ncbi:hypothetical protein GNP94_23275 [Paenibacillus campinasensis]|uniref:ATP-binding protein n=1 Tax=Paenibacillus campinasensis TaxID=66347 RepID=A0ABW9T8E4_9BACL|nr:ATP-binding protein [Paenibacillus campinasensis]MUG68892.1 hypothetical protein [Paenibacillus campinasensis]
MNIDLQGRIRNINLPTYTPLIPLFEAIVNSIQAVEATGEKLDENYIRIQVLRDTSQMIMDIPDSPYNYPITGFIISDTGVGFNDENFNSFKTSDSTYKSSIGGKGVGRLTWLKAFDSVKIESSYFDSYELKGRSFCFTIEEGVTNVEELYMQKETNRNTTVKLLNYKKNYASKVPKSLNVIANRIVEHCLSFFILEKCPNMVIFDEFDSINLNQHFRSHVDHNMTSDTFEINEYQFNIKHIKLLFAKDHKVYLCANNRVVRDERITNQIPGLPKKIEAENGETFVYSAYVTSDYFDLNVNAERTDFIGYMNDDSSILPDEISWKSIFEKIYEKASDYLSDYLVPIQRKKVEKINEYVMNEAPQYRRLLRNYTEKIAQINPDVANNKSQLDLELYKIKQFDEMKNLVEVRSILEMKEDDITDIEAYQKKYDEILQKINDESKMDLAKYIVKRRTLLNLLEKSLKIQDSGKYLLERNVHELIIPLRTTSDDIDFESHNLWIIDEKLAYHKYLASDIPLNKNAAIISDDNSRPDIIVFNHPHAFALEKPYNSIVIVEFKRPCRDDYDSNTDGNNPIDQVYNYISVIKQSKVRDKDGRPLNLSPNTPFYCYIICDMTSKLDETAKKNNYKSTPDGMGYFYFHDFYNAYIEIITYDKLLSDAMNRNRVLFDKLKIL